jgi:hypothetical protein
MHKKDQAVLAGLVIGLLVGAAATYALAGASLSRTATTTSTSTLVSASTVTSLQTVTSSTTVENTVTSVLTYTVLGRQPINTTDVVIANTTAVGGIAVAVNAEAGVVYVLGTSSLTVVNASSHSVIANVALLGNNTGGIVHAGLAVDLSTGTVYASVQGAVVEVNGTTDTVAGEIPLNLGTLAFDYATHVLWGTVPSGNPNPSEAQTGSLVGVDVRTGSIVANVSLGFSPYDVTVDYWTNMVYADGCSNSFVCGSEVAIVNGTSGTLVTTVDLRSAYFPAMTMNLSTDVLYVTGMAQLAALNGTDGQVIFSSNPQTCGPFLAMAVIPASNEVLMVPQNYDFLLVYNGTSGALVNMYSLAGPASGVAYNPNTDQLYLAANGDLLALHDVQATGNVNATMIGAGQTCGLP